MSEFLTDTNKNKCYNLVKDNGVQDVFIYFRAICIRLSACKGGRCLNSKIVTHFLRASGFAHSAPYGAL